MRLFLLIGFAVVASTNTQAQLAVPGSMSPDQKAALFYRHLPSMTIDEGYEFYFYDPKTLMPLSNQLVPNVPSDLRTNSAMDAFQSKNLLFNMLGSHLGNNILDTTRL